MILRYNDTCYEYYFSGKSLFKQSRYYKYVKVILIIDNYFKFQQVSYQMELNKYGIAYWYLHIMSVGILNFIIDFVWDKRVAFLFFEV